MGVSVRNITGARIQTGSYSGDNNVTQTIATTFKPKFIIIYGSAGGGALHAFVNGVTSENYIQDTLVGVSVVSGYVNFITNNSFTVTNTVLDIGSLNDLGSTYYWVGWA